MDELQADVIDTDWAFERYEALRGRFVSVPANAEQTQVPLVVPDLEAVADRVDAFILDAFGVLNVGDTAITGAVARTQRLRAMGKRILVLTNGATQSRLQALAKYRALGFDFAEDEVVASRDVAAAAMRRAPQGGLWAAACGPAPDFSDLAGLDVQDLLADPGLLDRADGFILFSSAGWTAGHQRRLASALEQRPRAVVVANPDLVAPREAGLSLEPGHFGHLLWDRLQLVPAFYGKPYPDAFATARARLGDAIPPARIAMVGDTLHTDILGGRAAGFATVLVTAHGLFAGRDALAYAHRAAILPDFVTPSI